MTPFIGSLFWPDKMFKAKTRNVVGVPKQGCQYKWEAINIFSWTRDCFLGNLDFFKPIESPPYRPDHLPIFEDQLLDGLQAWLDRLFEGSTYRYHINYWPEFPISPSNFVRS